MVDEHALAFATPMFGEVKNLSVRVTAVPPPAFGTRQGVGADRSSQPIDIIEV
jgi:hypothetical protein